MPASTRISAKLLSAGLTSDSLRLISVDSRCGGNQLAAMSLHARHLGFVKIPHLPGWTLDHDEVILAAYRSSPRQLPDHRALWEARSGRRASWWAIWDGEHFTGEFLANQTAAELRLLQLSIARAQPLGANFAAND